MGYGHEAKFRSQQMEGLPKLSLFEEFSSEPRTFHIQIPAMYHVTDVAGKEGENGESLTGPVQTLLVSATLVPAVKQRLR